MSKSKLWSYRSSFLLNGPYLVDIVVRALPGLQLVRICLDAVGQVRAEPLSLERNTVVLSVIPLLCWEIVVALPDLQANSVCRVCTGIEAEVGARKLDLCASAPDGPTLSGGSITVVNLHWGAIRKLGTANIHAFGGVEIGMDRSACGWELSGRAERYVIISVGSVA